MQSRSQTWPWNAQLNCPEIIVDVPFIIKAEPKLTSFHPVALHSELVIEHHFSIILKTVLDHIIKTFETVLVAKFKSILTLYYSVWRWYFLFNRCPSFSVTIETNCCCDIALNVYSDWGGLSFNIDLHLKMIIFRLEVVTGTNPHIIVNLVKVFFLRLTPERICWHLPLLNCRIPLVLLHSFVLVQWF